MPECDKCHDTGKRILPNGEQSGYLDCTHCGAAAERTLVEEQWKELMISPLDIMDSVWRIYQMGRQGVFAAPTDSNGGGK